jgi:precorrin-3B methylase
VLTDLGHLLEQEIDMGTTVIVGASQSFAFEGYLVTPRGYAGKVGLAGDDVPAPEDHRP